MSRRWLRFLRAIALSAAALLMLASCDEGSGSRVADEAKTDDEPRPEAEQQTRPREETEPPAEAVTGRAVRGIDREVSGGLQPVAAVRFGGLITTGPVRWGDALVVGTASGELVARDVGESDELWRAGLGDAPDALAATSTALFAAAGTTLHRVSPVTGELEWSVPLGGARAATALMATRSTLYLGLVDGTAIAFDPEDGTMRWRTSIEGTPVARMVLADGWLYLATEEGDLVAVDGVGGSLQWRHALGGAVAAGPANLAGRLAAVTVDGDVSVLGLDGAVSASFGVDAAPVLAPPAGGANRLVVFDGAGTAYGFKPDGTPVWRRTLAAHLAGEPGRVGEVAFAGEASGGMVAIGMSGGDIIARLALGAAPVGEAVIYDDELAWALTDGTVRRVDVDGEIEQAPLFSSKGSWVLPANGVFRLRDERVALTMRSDRDAVFEITVSAAPLEDLVLRVVSDDGATVATNMGKVNLTRTVRATLAGGATYDLVIERPDPSGEITVSVETRQLGQ